mgnify:CR=1 FL=1
MKTFMVIYQHWMTYRQSYVVDSIVVEAESRSEALRIAQQDYYLQEILSINEM